MNLRSSITRFAENQKFGTFYNYFLNSYNYLLLLKQLKIRIKQLIFYNFIFNRNKKWKRQRKQMLKLHKIIWKWILIMRWQSKICLSSMMRSSFSCKEESLRQKLSLRSLSVVLLMRKTWPVPISKR